MSIGNLLSAQEAAFVVDGEHRMLNLDRREVGDDRRDFALADYSIPASRGA